MMGAVELYTGALLVATVVVGGLIALSGVDDAFVDACYWLGALWRRKHEIGGDARGSAERLLARHEAPFAIMVPAWQEHEVIAAMVENTAATLQYRAYRIFCGVYRNDAATACEVERVALRHPGRVVRVEVPHDGPTCKADCLNHIVQRVFAEEAASGARFAGMVLHDSEDVIHPLELKLFNVLVGQHDLVQLPVFSLERRWREMVGGTYIDDFAEAHGKDILVRTALTGTVPGAGVATCYSRRALAALSQASGGEVFNTASLTEDYETSFRLREPGLSQAFAHVSVHLDSFRVRQVPGRTGTVVATHEFFPDGFRAAYRQRARWVIGIAFQGWQQLGWRGSLLDRYFQYRDRKALLMAPVGGLAYLLLANFALVGLVGSYGVQSELEWLLSEPDIAALLMVNLGFLGNRVVQRMYFVSSYYGLAQALLAVARMPVNNFINLFAVLRAWRLYLAHLVSGKKLAWDKTAHAYPDTLTGSPSVPASEVPRAPLRQPGRA
jgi:bacteriophage N4 adsorption protein B